MEPVFDENEVEMEIDVEKRFNFPFQFVEKRYNEKYLIIYSEGVLWLVLTEEEKPVFDLLASGGTIAEALERFEQDNVISVVSQIQAKQFECPVVNQQNEQMMYIYLTNNCNERCKHCYMYAGDVKIQELLPETWKQVLSEFKACGGQGVTFTGGEVTVYSGFKEVLKAAHDSGLSVTVLTNGIQWDENGITLCAEYIDEIQVSVDGYDKESYYSVRQYDGFDKAISTLLRFSEMGVRASMAVTPLYDDLDAFIIKFEPFAREILKKYPEIFIRFNLELLDGREVHSSQIDNTEYRKKIKALVERLYPNYYLEAFPLNYENHIIRKNCGFGEVSLAANGDVYWCNRIHELSSRWNILTTDMQTILKRSQQIKTMTDVDHTEACYQCEIRYICGGMCRMEYPGIQEVDEHKGFWNVICPAGQKEAIYEKMILCNEYFYTDITEE